MGLVYARLNLAPGFDNFDELQPLWQWNDCGVFDIYKTYIEIIYRNDEGREQAGSGRNKPISLPNCTVRLPHLHESGFFTIQEDILDGALIDNFVTVHIPVRVIDSDIMRGRTFNARLEIPEDTAEKYNGVEYNDVDILISEMIEVVIV